MSWVPYLTRLTLFGALCVLNVCFLGRAQVLKQCFGLARPGATATNTGYLLLYDCGE